MNSYDSEFASAERLPLAEVKRQAALFNALASCRVLDLVHDMVLVLNMQRQVVYCNAHMLRALGKETSEAVLGARPGELLQCMHAQTAPGGCGTSKACAVCGALDAVLKGLAGLSVEQECRITALDQGSPRAHDYLVCAESMDVGDEAFVAVTMQDISAEKRRQTLERVFLHDILNSAGGLRNLMELIASEAPETLARDIGLAYELFSDMVEEIKGQRSILEAESGSLKSSVAHLESHACLTNVMNRFTHHKAMPGHELKVAEDSRNLRIMVDPNLLGRVLSNMVVNALEATPQGGVVTLACREQDCRAVFSVHNAGAMAPEVQLQVFQRSYSTKGPGRGLGTYSIQLLTTRYLQGKAWFTSTPEQGTTFCVSLPLASH